MLGAMKTRSSDSRLALGTALTVLLVLLWERSGLDLSLAALSGSPDPVVPGPGAPRAIGPYGMPRCCLVLQNPE